MASEHREDIMESLEEMIADFALDKGIKEFEHGSGTLSYGQVIDALTLSHREYSYVHASNNQKKFNFLLQKLLTENQPYDFQIMFSDKNLFLFPKYFSSKGNTFGESNIKSIDHQNILLYAALSNFEKIEKTVCRDELYDGDRCIKSYSKAFLNSILQLSKEYLENGKKELKSKTKFNEDYNLYELPIKFIYEKSKKKIEEYK